MVSGRYISYTIPNIIGSKSIGKFRISHYIRQEGLMKTCYNCDAQQLNGTIFCSECGANIDHLSAEQASSCLHQSDETIPTAASARNQEREQSVPAASEQYLVLEQDNTLLPLGIQPEQEMIVGRYDNKRKIAPDIDLTQYNGYEAGVSRRHALIFTQNGMYMIRDLSSVNGTYVNGHRITTDSPIVLTNNDEVRFGELRLRVKLTDAERDTNLAQAA
jgi:hypothetical protein